MAVHTTRDPERNACRHPGKYCAGKGIAFSAGSRMTSPLSGAAEIVANSIVIVNVNV
jgi:hypothetical protein